MNKDLYYWYKDHGICTKCGRENAEPGKTMCSECLEKNRKYDKKRYKDPKYREQQKIRCKIYRERKKASGLCIWCGKKPAKYGALCYECYIRSRKRDILRHEKERMERLERGLIPEKRRKEGLCYWCGKPVIPGMRVCTDCRQKCIENAKKGYEAAVKSKNNLWINEHENNKKKKTQKVEKWEVQQIKKS